MLRPWRYNRQVSTDRTGARAVSDILIPAQGCQVHLKGYGWIKVFRTVATNGDAEYWATSQLDMILEDAAFRELNAWQVEVYHRGLKSHNVTTSHSQAAHLCA